MYDTVDSESISYESSEGLLILFEMNNTAIFADVVRNMQYIQYL